jgi:hypothetical protein
LLIKNPALANFRSSIDNQQINNLFPYPFLTNSYESITQATPRPSSLAPVGSVRTTRPLHAITTFSRPPVTSGGSVISNSTGDPTSSDASARI